MNFSESMNLELKQEATSTLKKEVVAFANTQGGTIYVGVADDGRVLGVQSPDQVLLQITNSVRDAIRPDVTLFTSYAIEEIEGLQIVKVSVQRGTNRPYYLAEKGLRPSGVYVRQGTASVPASEEAIRQMIRETGGSAYEGLRSLNQELTFDYALGEFGKRSLDFNDAQMKTLGVQNIDGLFTNLGLLLSDQCVHSIKAACFEGLNKNIFKDRREFGGSLLKQLVEAYTYIDLFNKTHATFVGLERIDKQDYPQTAIREALLNAVVHREYAFSGSTLINIFDDRIEFVSLGGLAPGLTLADILLGVSQTRNENLANLFYRLKLIEAYGTGISKILYSYRGDSIQPVFHATDGAFLTVLPNRNLELPAAAQSAARRSESSPQSEAVLKYLADHDQITRREVEQLLYVKQTRALSVLRDMVDHGLIDAVDRGKKVVYRRRRK